MAGMEAMQQKFGKLKWAVLFAPAIYYAENSVTLNASTAGFFNWRKSFLERTPEGKAFLAAGNTAEYKQGKKFFPPIATKTLRAVASHRPHYMSTAPWAAHCVRDGGPDAGKVGKTTPRNPRT